MNLLYSRRQRLYCSPSSAIEIQVFLKLAFDDKVCGAYTISNCSKAFSAACSCFAILTAMVRDPFKALFTSGKTGPLGPLPAVAFKTGWTSKSPTVPLCPLPPWSAIPSSERSEWLAFSLNCLTPAGSNAQTMAQSCTNYGISRGALVDRDLGMFAPRTLDTKLHTGMLCFPQLQVTAACRAIEIQIHRKSVFHSSLCQLPSIPLQHLGSATIFCLHYQTPCLREVCRELDHLALPMSLYLLLWCPCSCWISQHKHDASKRKARQQALHASKLGGPGMSKARNVPSCCKIDGLVLSCWSLRMGGSAQWYRCDSDRLGLTPLSSCSAPPIFLAWLVQHSLLQADPIVGPHLPSLLCDVPPSTCTPPESSPWLWKARVLHHLLRRLARWPMTTSKCLLVEEL